MRVLTYQDLNLRRVRPAFDKFRKAIESGDFRSAQVRKLATGSGPAPYWRAKLDDSNRLLLQFARRGDETVCLALEVIENHAYEKSRFLRGAVVDEKKLDAEPPPADPATLPAGEVVPLRWLPGAATPATKAAAVHTFELLDKPIFFDDTQEAVRRLPVPVVVVGSAGSGKTAVTLSKLREASGSVLYVTHSAYLAQSARASRCSAPTPATPCMACSASTATGCARPASSTSTSSRTSGTRWPPPPTTSCSSTRCRISPPCSSRWCWRC